MLSGLRAVRVDVVVFFSVVVPTFGATVRDATFGAAVFDVAVTLGLAATFDGAADVVDAFLIGETLPLTSVFLASVVFLSGAAFVAQPWLQLQQQQSVR